MGKGIIIDIGFTSDIETYIENLKSKIQSTDFQKIIGLSDAFDKEYQKMSEFIKAMQKELKQLETSDIEKFSVQLTNIQSLTEKLTKSFLTLFSALPKDVQKDLGITSIVKELSEIGGVCEEATTAIVDLTKVANGKVKIIDEKQIELLRNSYREIKRVLELIQEPRKKGGYDGFNDINAIIRETVEQYNKLQNAIQAYEKIKNGQGKGLSIDKTIVGYGESVEKLNGLINLYKEIPGANVNELIKPLKMSFSELSEYIETQLDTVEGIAKSRLDHLNEFGKKASVDLPSYFTQSTRKGEEPIRISLALQKGARKTLYNQVIEKVGQVQAELDQHPLIVEVQLASAYQSKKNQAGINEIKNQIAQLENQAAHAGSQAEALKITSISKNLTELIDRMNRQIDNALAITINIETERAMASVKRFINDAKAELEELKKSVVISPSFTIEPEQISQIKTDMVNAFTDKDNSDIKTTLIDTLLNKIKDVSASIQQLSNSLKGFVEKTFDENIILKAESLNEMYTQLLMVNEELNIFINGIRKLDNKTISQNMLAMAAEQSQAMQAVANIVRSMLPSGEAAEIELLFKNKDQTLETLASIKQEMLSIFDVSIVERWEKAVIDTLLRIKTSTGINLFNADGAQNSLNILSHHINDIIFSDQFLRKVGTHAEDYTDETNIIKSSVKDFTDAFSNYMAGLIDEKEYKSVIAQMSLDVAQRVADSHAEYGVRMKPREHSGILTKDLKVLGLSAGQKEGSSFFKWEDMYPELINNILSRIHSHAGDIVWMPSSSDLSYAASSHNTIPFDTTIAEKEIAVTNNARLAEFVQKYGSTVFDTIFDQIEDIINNKDKYPKYNKLLNSKKFTDFKRPYIDYRESLMQNGVAIDINREDEELEKRFLLEHLLKTQYKTPLSSLVKLYSPQTFAKSDPYELGLNSKLESQSNQELSSIHNDLQEILSILRTLNGEDELNVLQKRLAELDAAESRIKDKRDSYIHRTSKSTNDWDTKKKKPAQQNIQQTERQYTSEEQIELSKIEKERKAILARIIELKQSRTKSENTSNTFADIEKIDVDKVNKLVELFKTINQTTSNHTNIFTDFINSILQLPKTKNPLLTQLENIAKNGRALKAVLNPSREETKPKGTLEDAQKLLTNSGAKVRNEVGDYISKCLGILSPEQIESASKAAQDALAKAWTGHNAASDLVASGGMESSIAEEYANAFIETYKNAISKGLNVSLTEEQKQFLSPMMNEIQKLMPQGTAEFYIKELKATKDGLIDITALVKGANGEYQKLLLTYQQLGEQSSIWVKDVKIGADVAKAFSTETQATPKVKPDDLKSLGEVKVGTESWKELLSLASKFGIKAEEINKIVRNVDHGIESFQFFTNDGSRTTLGMNSETELWEKNQVVTLADDLKEYDKLVHSLSKSIDGAFTGDANSANDFLRALKRIREIWKNLQVYQSEGLISNDDLAELEKFYSGALSTISEHLSTKINGDNKSQNFMDLLGLTRENFESVRSDLDLTSIITQDEDSFKALSQIITEIVQNIIFLKRSERDETAATEKQVNTWITKMGTYLQKNSSIPKEYKQQINELIQDARRLQEQFGDKVPKELFTPIINQFTAIESKMAELGYSGRSMFAKIGTAMKNSILQVTRMYLSWYRLIAYVRQGVQEVTQMDTALTKMSYTMDVTDGQLQNMSKQMVDMAKDLSTSVANIEQIYQIYANLKTSQEELEKTARPTAILANLSSVDASTAADQIQGVINQFELTADATEHIVDVYDKISANIKVDYSKGIQGMADAVQQVGNFANQAGLSFEQLAAIVGRVMQQTRQEGGQIGTALKTNKIVSMYRNVHYVNISKTSKT